jgi:hypothetical protein
VNLKEMEASDMLDVIHYFFEDEVRGLSPELIEVRDGMRRNIYEELYGQKYAYGNAASGDRGLENLDDELGQLPAEPETPINPFSPRTRTYVPPTNFNPDAATPFGDILDAPIN